MQHLFHIHSERKNYYVKVRQVLAEEFFDFFLINTSQSSSTQRKMFFSILFLEGKSLDVVDGRLLNIQHVSKQKSCFRKSNKNNVMANLTTGVIFQVMCFKISETSNVLFEISDSMHN